MAPKKKKKTGDLKGIQSLQYLRNIITIFWAFNFEIMNLIHHKILKTNIVM